MAASVPTLVKAGAVAAGGSPVFGQATTLGNFLVAFVGTSGTVLSVCSDGTWSEAVGARAVASSGAHTQVFYKAQCLANEVAPTFTNSSNSMLAEFTLPGASMFTFLLDQAGAATDLATGAAVTAASADKNPAGNNLVVTADFWRVTVAGTDTTTDSYNSGAAATNLGNNDADATATGHYRFAYGVTTAALVADANTVTYSRAINHSAYSLASFRPVVLVNPVGIASGQAVGSHALRRLLAAVGVESAQAFGLADVLRILAPAGIVSGQTVGAHVLRRLLGATGISSSEAFGATMLIRVVSATAIAPGGAGTPAAVRLIFPSSIAPAGAVGIPVVVSHFLSPIDTNVLVSDRVIDTATVGDALIMSVMVSDMLADSVVVSEG